MRSIDEIKAAFAVGWHEVPFTYESDRFKSEFFELARAIWHNLPNGPEKTLALRSLWRTQSEVQLSLCLPETAPPVAP